MGKLFNGLLYVGTLVLVTTVLVEGKMTYQPAMAEAQAMEQMKILKEKDELQQYVSKLEQYFNDYKHTKAITELDMVKIRVMEQYLIDCGGKGGLLEGRANDFMNVCKFSELDMDVFLLWGMTIQETGAGWSDAIKYKSNVGGVFAGKTLRDYRGSIFRGITDMVVNLRYSGYYDKVEGLYTNNTTDTTIEQLGAIYCPVGASNDPTGLNQHWIPNVKAHYKELTNRYEIQIKL